MDSVRKVSVDTLKNEYINICEKIGHAPTSVELSVYSQYSATVFNKIGKTIDDKLTFCGIDKSKFTTKYYSHDTLLRLLHHENMKYYKKYNQDMTYDDIKNNSNLPNVEIYIERYGNIEQSIKLSYQKYERDIELLKQYIIEEYQYVTKRLGKAPTAWEYDFYCALRNKSTVSKIFGSFLDFQKICGVPLNSHGKLLFTKQDLLNKLVDLKNELGRRPTQYDVNHCEYTPSDRTYIFYFGSFSNALKEIGYTDEDIYENKQITPNGTVCLSRYEYLFARMLETHNIKFEKEVPYRKYIPNLKEWWKCDFEIVSQNENYFVEIFGITQTPSYDIKIKKKQLACKKNNIKLISIFPEDIMYKNYDQLYQMLKMKISHPTNYSFDDELDDLFDDM